MYRRTSLLHPAIAVLLTFLYVVCVITTKPDQRWQYFGYLVVLVSVLHLANISFLRFIKRMGLILPFFLFPAVMMLLFTKGEALTEINLFAVVLPVTREGVQRFSQMFLKSGFSGSAVIVLSLAQDFHDTMKGLAWFRIPKKFLYIIAMIFRYSFISIGQFRKMERSMNLRLFGLSRAGVFRVKGNLAGSLFLKSLDKGRRVHNAMLFRGFDGGFHEMILPPAGRRDMEITAISFVVVAFLKLWGI